MPGETNCPCTAVKQNAFIVDTPQKQLAANSVYEYKSQYEATSGKTYQFKSDWERMQYLLGKTAIVCNPPYVLIIELALEPLVTGATSLSSSWNLQTKTKFGTYSLTITYYSTTASTVPLTGGTPVGTTTSAAGINTNTLSFTPTSGLYYFVGITPTGGNEVRSPVQRMP